jgi:hypothetical protein
VNKHTQKLFLLTGGLCMALFLGVNSAFAEVYFPNNLGGNLPPDTLYNAYIQINTSFLPPVHNPPYRLMIETGDLTGNAGTLYQLIDENFDFVTCLNGGNTCRYDFQFTTPQAGATLGTVIEFCWYNDIGNQDCERNYNPALGNTLGQPNLPVAIVATTTNSTMVLDNVMQPVVTTFVEFLTQIFRDFWPFVLVFAIVAGFAKAVQKLLSIMTK